MDDPGLLIRVCTPKNFDVERWVHFSSESCRGRFAGGSGLCWTAFLRTGKLEGNAVTKHVCRGNVFRDCALRDSDVPSPRTILAASPDRSLFCVRVPHKLYYFSTYQIGKRMGPKFRIPSTTALGKWQVCQRSVKYCQRSS